MVSMLDLVRRHRIVAIVRGPEPERVHDACVALMDAGIRLIEVPFTTPGALEVIGALVQRADGDTRVGAGTVLDAEQVDGLLEVGGQFVVTPALTDAVPAAIERGLPVLAGAYTATEAFRAHRMGVDAVKLFPASAGGPAYLKALRDPFPDIPFIAVGGVGVAEARDYLAKGAVGVGVGSPLVGDALTGGSLEELQQRAKDFIEALA